MTAISPIQPKVATAADLLHLLADGGVPDEALAAGILASIETLDYAEGFYQLPSYLDEHLATFRLHAGLALASIAQARRLASSRIA